jgi:hypothetical protein
MDLRHLITAETAGLADRLAAALTAEIDASARRSQEAADAAIQKVGAEVVELRAALTKARAEEKTVQAALEKVRVEERALQGIVQKLRADETTLQGAVDKYRADEKGRLASIQKLQASEKTLQATIATLQTSEKTRVATIETLQASERKLQAQLAQAASALQASEKTRHATIEMLQASEKKLQAQLAHAASASALAEAELTKMQSERDAMVEEVQRAETQALEQTRSVRDQVLKIASAPLEHLRTAFQRLAAAATVDDVLIALVDALASEFSRVALFQVNGNRLEGRRQTGFDFGSDMSKVVVPLTKGSAIAEAVRSGRVQGLTAAELTDGSRKLFGGVPSFVLILPVVSAGQIHAVVYADNSDQPQPQFSTTKRSVQFAEILLCHAVPLIGKLAGEEKIVVELREYCTQLLTDLESVYDGDASAGHKGEKLQRRLQHNVEYARSMYAQRLSGRTVGADLFDAELTAIAARKKSSPFGRDLAAATAADDDRKQAS